MTIRYPVVMILISSTSSERPVGSFFGQFHLGDYNNVNLNMFMQENLRKKGLKQDPVLVHSLLEDLNWVGFENRPDFHECIEEMEWFLHGFCRGVQRARAMSKPLHLERAATANYSSIGWSLGARVAFTTTQFLIGATEWEITLGESTSGKPERDGRGRFVKNPAGNPHGVSSDLSSLPQLPASWRQSS